jgi:two-component system NtrC family sensor kinase
MKEDSTLRLDGSILQALLDLLPGTLHVKDRELRYCVANRNYLERWGAKAEAVIGRTSEEAFGDLFGGGPDERNREVFATGKALPFYEVTYPDKQGGNLVLWSTKVPILDEHGIVTHVLTFSLDITPLKRMQHQLRESEQLRSAIVEHSLECFITAQEDGRIVEFNPAAEQIFGCTRAEALGRPIGQLLHTIDKGHPADTDGAWQRSRALLERSGQRFETLGARADGTTLPIEVSLVEIPLREQRLFTACVRELGERQRAQAELERQRQALYQSERLSVLGTLAAGISHELRNPLSVVVSQAKLLEDELSGEKPQARLQAILRAAERCAAIVSAFLDQSRYGPRKTEHFTLTQVVESALDLTAHVLREQGISLAIEHAHPDVTVKGDPHQLSQVVLNLVLNAATAMQANDGPRRLVIATGLNESRDKVELSISDSGPGIAPELRERIFERFFTTKAGGGGTGLGLAICRDIVSAHGGRIGAHASAQGGALFRVELPVSRGNEPLAARAIDEASPVASYRVLVVDDESEIANLLREILELAGHEVDVADSGESALRCIANADYHFVLSDIRMPGMDGTMLYEVLGKQHPELVRRLAFITGDTLSPNVASFLKRTRIPHLAKPFHPRQVTELVGQLARTARGPGGGRPA